MSETFRLTLAQMNPVLGDIPGNIAKAKAAWEAAKEAGTALLALPEGFVTGYQPQDLVMRPAFLREAMTAIEALAADCADGPALAIGGPFHDGAALYNAYYVCEGGAVRARVLKQRLPNESVFDEKRVYAHAPAQDPVKIGPLTIGAPICEDAWWADDICTSLAASGAEMLLVPNGSPYCRGKLPVRYGEMRGRVAETGLPLIYLNLVGGQDDQVFDGVSFGVNPGGEIAFQMPQFDEALTHVTLEKGADGWRIRPGEVVAAADEWESDYRVMVESLRDYMSKTGFKKALLGLSGGIDSAIVATIAVDALGAENVRCVMLPSEYTSRASLDDAEAVAKALGVRYDDLPISGPRAAVTEALAPLFAGTPPDLTEENIQSRLRGLLLMALSNKFGEMLLTTGNKSEVAVGYATIYGDMAGGYNPIKDLYKTRVFEAPRDRQAALGGAARRPEGRGQPAALRGARRDPRRAGRPRGERCGTGGGGLRPRHGQAHRTSDFHQRIQEVPVRPRHTPDGAQLLAGPPLPHREPLA